MNAESIARKLRGVCNGAGFLVRCPVPGHGRGRGDRNPSLSIRDGDNGQLSVRCFAGCDPRTVLTELRRLWLGEADCVDTQSGLHKGRRSSTTPSWQAVEQAIELWRSCRSAEGSAVETYLRLRGITVNIPPSIRFHVGLRHAETGLLLPCMVAGVQGIDGRISAVHRTYLQADGCAKAPVRNPKKMLGSCAGGAVRFTTAGRRLGIAEGIETGLSVRQAQPDLPVWAALSAVGMMRVEIPDHVRELVVLADGDEPGEAAAQALARRPDNAGRLVRIARAPPGLDFNDLLQGERGRAAHG